MASIKSNVEPSPNFHLLKPWKNFSAIDTEELALTMTVENRKKVTFLSFGATTQIK
jgi:hypothetical protein